MNYRSDRATNLKHFIITIILICLVIVTVSLLVRRSAKLKVYTFNQNSSNKEGLEEKLYNQLVKDINDLEIPGLQVSIVVEDKEYNFSIGTVDYARKIQITNDDILRVGSVTKLYTSTIIMKLIEEGDLSLSDTIDKWFVDMPNAKNITIKNLLNHTSGIYDYTGNYSFLAKTILSPKKVWESDEIYKYAIKGNPKFKPGEKHQYSNSNYLLLGMIAENIKEMRYNELLNDIIFDDLSIKNTYYPPFEEDIDLLITGYDRDLIPLGIHKIKPDNNAWASGGYSAGGIASNSIDIMKFMRGLFSYKIIKKETLDKMIEFESFIDDDIPEQTGYGLGIRRLVIEGDTLIGHTGTIPGFGGAAFYCPDKNYYISLLGNVSYLKQTHLLNTIVKVINE